MSAPPTWRWGDPVERLQEVLAAGGVLAIPTESSYGLGIDPRSPDGVEAVYRVKERGRGKPLPVVFEGDAQLAAVGVDPADQAVRRVAACWPGPVTLLAPAVPPPPAAAGGATLAVRRPGHARLRRLLVALGSALTATSANRSGEPPIHDPAELLDILGGVPAAIVDDGPLPPALPSTIVELRAGRLYILRSGAFAASQLERCAGLPVVEAP